MSCINKTAIISFDISSQAMADGAMGVFKWNKNNPKKLKTAVALRRGAYAVEHGKLPKKGVFRPL